MTTNEVTPKRYSLLINGEWREASSGETSTRLNPADQSPVAVLPMATEGELDAAVAAARAAFDAGAWSGSVAQRAAVLRTAGAKIRAEAQDLAQLLVREVGKPLGEAMIEIFMIASICDAYASMAENLHGRVVGNASPTALGLIMKEPVGVVAAITPWNWPLLLLLRKVGGALAAGCTMVARPSILTGASTYEIARIFTEAGAPPGVLNVVTGAANLIGEKLVQHPGVDKVCFTGSTAVGKHIMELASHDAKRVSLELGGKSPNIVFADANLEAAVGGAVIACYLNCGQTCSAGTRLLLERGIHDSFMEMLVGGIRGMKVGDPMEAGTNIGPLVSEEQLRTVQSYVDIGIREGAKLVLGGKRLTDPPYDKGFFFEPTVFDEVRNDMRIAREEIFGPVLTVTTFDDADQAMSIANDNIYGLAAGIWSSDLGKCMRFIRGLKAGSVYVNCYYDCGVPNLPFGGYKQSGIGREEGIEGLELFLETKSVHMNHG